MKILSISVLDVTMPLDEIANRVGSVIRGKNPLDITRSKKLAKCTFLLMSNKLIL